MFRRLPISVLLVIALVAMTAQAPAQMCGMRMPAPMVQCDCCATMKSCVLPQQNPAKLAAAAQSSQQSIAMIAPVLHQLVAPMLGTLSRSGESPPAQPSAHSPPRLALFCTFLI
jgi:hypothetical protein